MKIAQIKNWNNKETSFKSNKEFKSIRAGIQYNSNMSTVKVNSLAIMLNLNRKIKKV
jgi:hypothetical protein